MMVIYMSITEVCEPDNAIIHLAIKKLNPFVWLLHVRTIDDTYTANIPVDNTPNNSVPAIP